VKALVITVSDSRHAGQNRDQSGPAVAGLLAQAGYEVEPVTIVPDERDQISGALKDAVVAGHALIVTTGGTGLGPRDVTPEATAAVLDFAYDPDAIRVTATARVDGQTGVEMEALTAAAVAGLTLIDMVKSLEKGVYLESVRLLSKSGGKSGTWTR